ncbi:MAG: hypothetical protein JWN04_2858 [Myxococcaceae bacterium]|nr:hypothetical protein [Myxococcaceae bacterium]
MSTNATREPPVQASSVLTESRRRKPLTLILPLLPLLAVAAVWYFAGLGELNSSEKTAAAARALRDSPAAFAYVLLAFSAATLLFFPITALITGSVLAFDPLRGFAFAYAGTLLASCVTYWAGRLMGGRALDYVSGPRMLRFGELMRKHAIRASIAARILPVGSFTGINLFAGSLRIPFGWFFVGNLIGIFPGVLFLTLFAERLTAVLRAPSWENLTYLALALTSVATLLLLLRWRGRRRAAARDPRTDIV